MHNFGAQPSPSYQPLTSYRNEKVPDGRSLQSESYSITEPLVSAEKNERDVKANAAHKDPIILRFISRLTATCIAIITSIQEIDNLTTYIRTRYVRRDGRGPWAQHTLLWPTIMLLATSLVTTCLGVLIMIAYLFSIKKANKVSSVQTWTSVIMEITHIVVWIVVAVLYRLGKTGKDLWGWACSPLARHIQLNFENVVDFDAVCSQGARSWHLALASAAVQALGGIIWFFVYCRSRIQKRMKNYG